MANQYTVGRPATREEILQSEINFLEARLDTVKNSLAYVIELLTEKYKAQADPDICRILIIHGVDVWAIDRERGVKTVYTTPRNKGK